MPIRLTLGHVEGFDDTIAAFAQQLGLTSIQFHTPSDLSGKDGFWSVDELVDFGVDYAARARKDHALFVEAFREGAFDLVSAVS